MKKTFYYLVLGTFAFLAACSDDDSKSSVNVQPVIDAASSGTWHIASYIDSENNHTARFEGYNFTFGASNIITAANGTNTHTGSWSVTNSSSGDDSHHDDIDFNINFSSPANFVELSDDWDIVSYTADKIQLIDVSGGNGGTDHLTFEKN